MTPSRAAQEKPTSPRTANVLLGKLLGRHHRDMVRSAAHCSACQNYSPTAAEVRVAIEREAAAATPSLDPDRLTAVIESRMSSDLAWLKDDGKTIIRLGPEEAAYLIAHLYRTGDVVSGLPPLASDPAAPRTGVGE